MSRSQTTRRRTRPATTRSRTPRRPPGPAASEPRCCESAPRPEPARFASLADRFRALADPTRLAILARLTSAGRSVCACELGEGFTQGQPTISHHLRVLREAGLVRAQRRGTWIHYEVDADAMAGFEAALGALAAPSRTGVAA